MNTDVCSVITLGVKKDAMSELEGKVVFIPNRGLEPLKNTKDIALVEISSRRSLQGTMMKAQKQEIFFRSKIHVKKNGHRTRVEEAF